MVSTCVSSFCPIWAFGWWGCFFIMSIVLWEFGCFFIESVEDTNEVIRVLCWRHQWSIRVLCWRHFQLMKTVQDDLNLHQVWKEVGFGFIVKKCKSWRISTQLKFGSHEVSSRIIMFTLIVWSIDLLSWFCDALESRSMFWFWKSVSMLGWWIAIWCLYIFMLCLCKLPFLWCRQPRGFGFVQYLDPADAADAKYHMDGHVLLGRELTVVFAEENRKKPSEMRARERRRWEWVLLQCSYFTPTTFWSLFLDDVGIKGFRKTGERIFIC